MFSPSCLACSGRRTLVIGMVNRPYSDFARSRYTYKRNGATATGRQLQNYVGVHVRRGFQLIDHFSVRRAKVFRSHIRSHSRSLSVAFEGCSRRAMFSPSCHAGLWRYATGRLASTTTASRSRRFLLGGFRSGLRSRHFVLHPIRTGRHQEFIDQLTNGFLR